MSQRARYAVSAVVLGLAVAGSYVSFTATGSQAQFAALNAVFFTLAALVALIGAHQVSRGTGWTGVTSSPMLGYVGAAFVAWAVISSLLSGRFATAVTGEPTSLVGLGALACSIALGGYAALEHSVVRRSLLLIAPVVAATQGVWALLQPVSVVDAGHGGYGNSSALGLALALLLPWVLAFTPEGLPFEPRMSPAWAGAVRWGCAVLLLGVAFRTESRAALVLMLATIAWYAAVTSALSQRVKSRVVAAVGAGIVIVTLAMVYLERAGRLPFGFLTIRYTLWATAMRALAKRSVLGYGADGFFSSGASVSDFSSAYAGRPLIFTDGTTDPHNVLVLIAVSFGVVGVLLAIAWMASWYASVASDGRIAEKFDPAVASVVVGTLVLLTMPVTLDVLPLIAIIVGLSLSGTAAHEGAGEPARGTRALWRMQLVLIGAVVLACLSSAVGGVLLGPVTYYAPAPLGTSARLAGILRWDPYFAHQVNASFAAAEVTDQNDSALAVWQGAKTTRATTLDRHNPYYALAYAQALWNAGRPISEVEAAYRAAVARYRSFPAAHAELALLYATTGRPALARGELDQVYAFGEPQGYPWQAAVEGAERALAGVEQ